MRLETQVRIPMRPHVVKLLQDHGPRFLNGFRHLAEMGDHLVRSVQVIPPRQHPRAMHRHRLADDHRRPAQRPLQQIARRPRAGQAVLGHVVGMRAKNDAIAKRLPA